MLFNILNWGLILQLVMRSLNNLQFLIYLATLIWVLLFHGINSFVPNAPFLYLLKT